MHCVGRMQRYLVLKQVVHIVTAVLQRVELPSTVSRNRNFTASD
jgi:hypothetical protein